MYTIIHNTYINYKSYNQLIYNRLLKDKRYLKNNILIAFIIPKLYFFFLLYNYVLFLIVLTKSSL